MDMRRLARFSSVARRGRGFGTPVAASGVVRLRREADDAMRTFLSLAADDPRREAAADRVEAATHVYRRALEREAAQHLRTATRSPLSRPPRDGALRANDRPRRAGGRQPSRRRTARVARAGDSDGPQPHHVEAAA